MIYLLRHGEDDESYIGGWSNVDLTPKGKEQVKEKAKYIKEKVNVKKIISSDIKRAVSTAEIVANELGLIPHYTNKLRELDKGLLTGQKKEIAQMQFPEYFKNVTVDTVYPNGESMVDLYERSKLLLEDIKNENDVLIVTHRGVINMFYFLLNNKTPDMNKEQFDVTHSSIHEFDPQNNVIRRIA